jgi:hypothetical protein
LDKKKKLLLRKMCWDNFLFLSQLGLVKKMELEAGKAFGAVPPEWRMAVWCKKVDVILWNVGSFSSLVGNPIGFRTRLCPVIEAERSR